MAVTGFAIVHFLIDWCLVSFAFGAVWSANGMLHRWRVERARRDDR